MPWSRREALVIATWLCRVPTEWERGRGRRRREEECNAHGSVMRSEEGEKRGGGLEPRPKRTRSTPYVWRCGRWFAIVGGPCFDSAVMELRRDVNDGRKQACDFGQWLLQIYGGSEMVWRFGAEASRLKKRARTSTLVRIAEMAN
ncbi:hypothetical protein E2542_SST06768 [Spatholobus suberectus]|nr:hypothetical protein E2542_SST06768 [Spatholobus suberectus]